MRCDGPHRVATPPPAPVVAADLLATQEVDYTLFFRHLTRVAAGESETDFIALFNDTTIAETWLREWRQLAPSSPDSIAAMQTSNPIRIPRNHRIEQAIQAALKDDYAPFHRLVDALAHPYTEDPTHADLEAAPAPDERVTQTFCGT